MRQALRVPHTHTHTTLRGGSLPLSLSRFVEVLYSSLRLIILFNIIRSLPQHIDKKREGNAENLKPSAAQRTFSLLKSFEAFLVCAFSNSEQTASFAPRSADAC